MAANLFKRRSTAVSSDFRGLTESETALAQSSFNVEKITDIQNKFAGGEVLLVTGRIFIREGVLWKVCRKGPKKRQFFLFNDIMVYGTVISRGRYGNQHIMPLNSMTVFSECYYMPQVDLDDEDKGSSSPSELKPENAFQINHCDKSFHVYTHSKADKTNWITNLNKQISKINRGQSAGSETLFQRPVWVPDSASKQCMICKQKFTAFIRKHHCRMCGRVICSHCSPEKADISQLSGAQPSGKLERICKHCNKPLVIASIKDDTKVNEENVKQNVKVHVTDEESTETEDSDDSEEIPIPPPRKKKLQQSKSLDERKRNIPPPRPSYSPAKGALLKKAQEKKEENEIPTEQPNPKTGSESSSVFIHKELNLETKVPEVAINKQDFSVSNNSSDDDIIKSDSYTKEQVSELDEVKHDSHTRGEQEIKPDFHETETEEVDLVKPIPRPRHKKIITKNESSDMHQITNEINSKTIDNQDEGHSDKSGDTSSQEHSGRSSPRLDISGGDTPPQDRSSKEEEQLFQTHSGTALIRRNKHTRVVDNEDTTSPSDSITDHSTKTDESPKPQPRSPSTQARQRRSKFTVNQTN